MIVVRSEIYYSEGDHKEFDGIIKEVCNMKLLLSSLHPLLSTVLHYTDKTQVDLGDLTQSVLSFPMRNSNEGISL